MPAHFIVPDGRVSGVVVLVVAVVFTVGVVCTDGGDMCIGECGEGQPFSAVSPCSEVWTWFFTILF